VSQFLGHPAHIWSRWIFWLGREGAIGVAIDDPLLCAALMAAKKILLWTHIAESLPAGGSGRGVAGGIYYQLRELPPARNRQVGQVAGRNPPLVQVSPRVVAAEDTVGIAGPDVGVGIIVGRQLSVKPGVAGVVSASDH